ncbi:class I SAM-dependent methyltransferase [Dactylosporangium sp. CA-233914]|uniref:class I SAM-dependent methyltransferase n=1 Tax=Dactylosporangium sp. CA-233914 TaxID=3239934 RepID=UPI003D921282
MTRPPDVTQQFWEALYTAFNRPEPGPVNRFLTAEIANLAPGTALDLGCADGADAIWLAGHGWTVVGVDVSETALERARAHTARLGLSGRIIFERHDLAASFPDGRFDLVSAQFLHSPVAAPGERAAILRRAAEAVAAGGHLLVVSHQSMPPWHSGLPAGLTEHLLDLTVPTPAANLAALALPGERWEALRSETVVTEVAGLQGQSGVREDHVLHFRRRV